MSNIIQTNVVTQMQEDYGAYALAVLHSRAIPDLYDGLKPAQRRVLQTMIEEKLTAEKPFVKCARVTGLTLAFYHPQGSCYGTLINMATEWTNNVPWINVHGNIGSSIDGPAAERYTECKLRQASVDILLQDRIIWDTRDSYDGSRREAVRFNSAIPTVLLNGDTGIACGYATKIAPHGLRSIIEATKLACKIGATIKERSLLIKRARDLLLPDFPTGCDIVRDEYLQMYTETGGGSIRCRAKMEAETQIRSGRAKDREKLIFTHLPPYVNPEKIGEQIKDALEKGKFDGVAEVIDESDLTGDRVVVISKPGVDVKLLTQQLYAFTDLDTRYSAKTLVIDGLLPVELSPVEICQRWFSWRMDRLEKKFSYELKIASDRLHIVDGLLQAIDKLDAIIKKIRASSSKTEALSALMSAPFKFTRVQSDAILEMRLRQLTNLDKFELDTEKSELDVLIIKLTELAENSDARAAYAFEQMDELAKRHGQARRSQLIEAPDSYSVARNSGEKRTIISKPKFLKIDMQRGVIEQTKIVKGSTVVEKTDKLIVLGENGLFKKLPSSFKGGVFDSFTPLVMAKKELDVASKKYLAVFKLDGALKAMVLEGVNLAKTTSSGKRWLPEGSELVHFGEGSYKVEFASTRKKPIILDLLVKAGKPAGKGIKVAALTDLAN
jgi:DNA gyrase subunit A